MKRIFFFLVTIFTVTTITATTVYTRLGEKPAAGYDGTYLIVYQPSETEAWVWDGEDGSNNFVSVPVSGGKITSDALANYQAVVSIEDASKAEYKMHVSSGYVGADGSGNTLTFTPGPRALHLNMNKPYVTITANNNTKRLLFRPSGTSGGRFRFYTNSGDNWTSGCKPLYLYALGDLEFVDSTNPLDINYAQVDMYACDSKFPTTSNPYDQYFSCDFILAQQESDDAVPYLFLEILAPTAYSLEGTYKSSYTPKQKYYIDCTNGSHHSYFRFPSSEGGTIGAINNIEMTITKVGASSQPNAYTYHIKLTLTDSNNKYWSLDKDVDVFAQWIECNQQTHDDMPPVAFTLESNNHNPAVENALPDISLQEAQDGKILIDGHIYIIHNGSIYDIMANKVQ